MHSGHDFQKIGKKKKLPKVLDKKIDKVFRKVESIRKDQIYDSEALDRIEHTLNYLVKRIRDLERKIDNPKKKRGKRNASNRSSLYTCRKVD